MKLANKTFLASLDAKADAMKAAVLNTESKYTLGEGCTTYYFAADGDDGAAGTSPDTALRTLGRLAALPLKPGDVVLFRRGDMFRGNIHAAEGITYSAYGEGAKPIINSSRQNYADPALWEKTDYENVWVCTEKIVNAGIVTLDHTGEIGKYDELVGKRMIKGVGDFCGVESMKEDLQVWSDLDGEKLYFYSADGNPGARFSDIEIGERGNTIDVRCDGVTIDNLHITLTGSHGVGAGTQKNLTVRNCLFNWLGGSILTGYKGLVTVGYGNAVEVYGGCDGYHVYNNWMYQIYDTGITHQFSFEDSVAVNTMDHVEYYDNLIEYCFWSIEYYNFKPDAASHHIRSTKNTAIHDNFCRFGGEGWGCPGRAGGAPMCCFNTSNEEMENFVAEHNIFDRCTGVLILSNNLKPRMNHNTWIQPYGVKFARIAGETYLFDESAADTLAKMGETEPKLYYIKEN
ncbi:MAG: hypothetical protein J6C52_02285 [Clostridia bacterium]|nr:hypothetical protein [Clostridia bacterium]